MKNNLIYVNFFLFPLFIGTTFSVYKGNKFINVKVSEKMIGSKIKEHIQLKKKNLKSILYGKNKKRY